MQQLGGAGLKLCSPCPSFSSAQNMAEALKKHSDVTVLVNFASFRSAYSVTVEALNLPQLRTVLPQPQPACHL